MRTLIRSLFPLGLVLLAGGCASLPSGDQVLSTSGEWLSRTGEVIGAQRERLSERFARGDDTDPAEREAEVEALLEQPWIDPLTRYLEAHAEDPERADALVRLSRERDRRCAAIAEEYAERPANRETLERYRRGYLFSCPAEVNAFHARVRDAEAAARAAAPPSREAGEPAGEVPAQSEAGDARQEAAVARREASDCYLYFTIRNLQQARQACAGPAEQGDARAQHHMGRLAELAGEDEQALTWFRRAADGGDEQAAARLEALAGAADGDESEVAP